MTAVLPTRSHPGGYTPDQSESEDYINTLHYISDTDTEGYSGNPASPLILGGTHDTTITIRGPYDGRDCASTAGPQYSLTRGRWGEVGTHRSRNNSNEQERAQLSMVALLLATVRRSLLASCQAVEVDTEESSLEIGWPTDVQHVAHVTFDRYNGFLGLPEEFEVEVPGRVPSARFVPPSFSNCLIPRFVNTSFPSCIWVSASLKGRCTK